MKLRDVLDLRVAVELLPDDCLAIADALACYGDRPGNQPHLHALQAAFAACAVLAASDTNMDEATPAREWHAKTRRVWGAVDTTRYGQTKVTEGPRYRLSRRCDKPHGARPVLSRCAVGGRGRLRP